MRLRADGVRPATLRARKSGFGAELGLEVLLLVHGAAALKTCSRAESRPHEPTTTETSEAASPVSEPQIHPVVVVVALDARLSS